MLSEASLTGTNKVGRVNADWVGVVCSVACAVHCAATPILLFLLPSVSSLRWLADPLFHQVVALVCVAMVVSAILPGMRIHRNWQVGSLAGMGIFLLLSAAFILPDTCCDHEAQNASQPLHVTNLAAQTENLHSEHDHEHHAHEHVNSHSQAEHSHTHNTALLAGITAPILNGDFIVCTSDCCLANQPLGQTLISTEDLQAGFGGQFLHSIATTQPYLSPIGGMLLIIAHLLNIRLRCCSSSTCPKASGR